MVYIVTASINELKSFAMRGLRNTKRIIVVDEGDKTLRIRNKNTLWSLDVDFYGPKEREKWFKDRFGSEYRKYLSTIPRRCHAETSFGFLVGYEENAEVIVELDDDVKPIDNQPLINLHLRNLYENNGVKVCSRSKWYNTIENLELNESQHIFPRGYPYDPATRVEDYVWINGGEKCVLNMGLWTKHLDLDALTILYHKGINGKCNVEGKALKRQKVIVGKGTFLAVCSMNTAFRRNIIPAFYQLYMNFMGVDRFDDIWSGIFLKKIADHLRDNVCLGQPLVSHDKRLRDVFKDLRKELEGIVINELLWRIVDEIELDGKSYWDCYRSLIEGLKNRLDEFKEPMHRKFMQKQIKKMKLWLEIIDKLR